VVLGVQWRIGGRLLLAAPPHSLGGVSGRNGSVGDLRDSIDEHDREEGAHWVNIRPAFVAPVNGSQSCRVRLYVFGTVHHFE
jgi:hypothetical protein